MPEIAQEYVDRLAPIYQDLLKAFAEFDTSRRAGEGLAFQSLYSLLDGKYSLTEIREACQQMEAGGAMEIRHQIFAHPTELGERIITKLTGKQPPTTSVPPFSPPPGWDKG